MSLGLEAKLMSPLCILNEDIIDDNDVKYNLDSCIRYIMNSDAGKEVLIVKRSSEREPFFEAKLRHSLRKALA
jgi:hypothetical protein